MEDSNEENPLLHINVPNSRKKKAIIKLVKFTILFSAIIIPLIVIIELSTSQSLVSAPVILRAAADDNNVGAGTTKEPVDNSIQVEVEQGILQGKRETSRGGRDYLTFRGVPYAKPPLGNLRFKSPVEPEPWDGVRDATVSQAVCIQKRSGNKDPHGSEDCLYLNIFTPKTIDELGRRRQRNLYPVIMYVHGGGGGAQGDGSRYSGAYFMDEDVVLVTIDYRLGMLGSLNLNITEASGNQGLKDQVMGLKWVKSNIRKFGGDPNKVTLFGNSAGAHQVSTHMISAMSRSLFQAAIVQSGTTILPGFLSGNPVQDGIDLGIKINCSIGNITQLLECFMNTSAEQLVLNSIYLRHWFTFTYSIDTAAEPGDQFLPESPLTLLQNGNISNVPFMIGIVSAEGLPQALQVLNDKNRTAEYNEIPWTNNSRVIQDLQLQLSAKEPGIIAEKARNFYFANGTKNVSIANVNELNDLMSDRLFHHAVYITAQSQFTVNNSTSRENAGAGTGRFGGRRRNQNGKNPVFMYIFTHKINVSRCQDNRFKVDAWGLQDYGICHAGDELQFFFPNGGKGGIYPDITLDNPYANFSKMVVHFWASFATDYVPSGATNNATWLPLDGSKPLQAFELNDEPKMLDYYPERMEFWDQFDLNDLYR